MPEILFNLVPDLDDQRRDEVFSQVRALPGVTLVAPIKKDATSRLTRSFCFARVADGADLSEVAERLRAVDGIAHADLLPIRKLP